MVVADDFTYMVCPGRWLAVETVWFTVATVLAAFNVTKVRNDQGQVLEPDTEFTSSFLRYAMPIRVFSRVRLLILRPAAGLNLSNVLLYPGLTELTLL